MLSAKTVFVVGAGASFEVGLPIGETLKEKIAGKLKFKSEHGHIAAGSGDRAIYEFLLRNFSGSLNEKLKACRNIADGIELSASIDSFIDSHKHDTEITECGKIAIVRTILEAEINSKLYVNPSNIYNKFNTVGVRKTWLKSFYIWLTQDLNRESLATIFDNVTIVSFNYDRCIQHFLVHALSANFLISPQKATTITRKLHIFFPFGSVGPYLSETEVNVPFGSESLPNGASILNGLKTYTERIEDSAGLTGVRDAIAQADQIIFLGNAYHPTNMKLLCGGKAFDTRSKDIYGTRKGVLSDDDLETVKISIGRVVNEKINKFRFAETCFDLFEEYGRSMKGF